MAEIGSDSQGKIRIVPRKADFKLSGGVVIESFPETGLAGTIAASCLISSLKISLVGEIWSDYFPPLATVVDGKLQAPARVYADAKAKLAIFLGDFTPGQRASHVIARAIIDWAKEKECRLVLTSFSTPMQEGTEEHAITAVANDQKAEETLRRVSIPLAKLTAVGGVSGRLLLEGREAGIPVIALLIKTHRGVPDFESGLKLAEATMRIVPNAKCDLEAIRGEAEQTEGTLRSIKSQAAVPEVYR